MELLFTFDIDRHVAVMWHEKAPRLPNELAL